MSTLRDRYGYLPFPLPYILEAEGEDFMFEVVDRLGGRTFRLPLSGAPRPDSIAAREQGEDGARRLVRILGGKLGIIRVTIPTMRAASVRAAEVRIIHARAAGQTVAAIALREGLTERGVYQMLARARAAGITADTPSLRDPRKIIPFPKRGR